MWEAVGYRMSAEIVMGTWVVTVRVRFLNEEMQPEWCDLLAFQTTQQDWSDPSLEVQSLMMQVARRLE